MNTENEKRLDDLFKKKLEDPVDEVRYEEGDWDALESMLDKPKRRGIIYLLPILSGVAAVLLVFFGWWIFKYKGETPPTKGQQHVVAGHKKADTIVENMQAAAGHKKIDTIVEPKVSQLQAAKPTTVDTIVEHRALKQTGIPTQKSVYGGTRNSKSLFAVSSPKLKKDTIADRGTIKNNRMADELVAVNQSPVIKNGSIAGQPIKQIDLPRPVYRPSLGTSPVANSNAKARAKFAYRPQYTLSVIAAPDLNGVGSFQQSKVGTNIGLGFNVGLSKRLSVSTGALYSVKPYATNFDNYRNGVKWPVSPDQVTADCRMLDIPLNVNYMVYHKQQNKLSFGTGLSSYLMLHESYKFQYGDSYGGATGPSNYTVPNAGKYFFGVVNLNATYERQINSKVGLSIQPYMKLPLTNIGYSQVKLQTTGVAVGLTWNLNSLTKP